MKNGYDHDDHQGIYTYNLSVPKRLILDVPNQSPPYLCTKIRIGVFKRGTETKLRLLSLNDRKVTS